MDLFGEAPQQSVKDASSDINAFDDSVIGTSAPAEEVGLAAPRSSLFFLGHARAEAEILQLYTSNRMPHALILSGPEGIGKATFAFRIARFLLSRQEADPNQDALFGGEDVPGPASLDSLALEDGHPVFSKVASGGHSDLKVIERRLDEAKGTRVNTLEVAEIRKVSPFLRKTAAEADWRVILVDDADTMNANSQNALLKILEEPPERTFIILVAHRVGALIPTIRSRARVLSFSSLSQSELRELLRRAGHALSDEQVSSLYRLCGGSIGKALQLIDQGGLDVMAKILTMFEDYPQWRWSQIHVLAEELSRTGQAHAFSVFDDVMQWIAQQLACAKARGLSLTDGPLQSQIFQDIKDGSSLEDLLKTCDTLKQHFTRVRQSNLEKRQAVLYAFSCFGE